MLAWNLLNLPTIEGQLRGEAGGPGHVVALGAAQPPGLTRAMLVLLWRHRYTECRAS
jgi:hypothetical protein